MNSMDMYINGLKSDLENMDTYDKITDDLDAEIMALADMGKVSLKKEDEYDCAYSKYIEFFEHAALTIVTITGGRIDEDTAKKLITCKRENINDLLMRHIQA